MLSASAAAGASDPEAALNAGQAAIGRTVPDLAFTDSLGQGVSLAAYRGRPLVVSLVYTACGDVCPVIVQRLLPAVDAAQEALGPDSFAVLTIGFDARHDSPERMRAFARAQGVDLPNWRFLAGERAAIDALAEAVGFTFAASAGGFEHTAQVSIVDADGRVYRQVYGEVFETPAIVEPLKDLVFGRNRPVTSLEGLLDRVRLFCTVYDPRSGRYYFDYSLFLAVAIGAACLLVIAVVLWREWRRSTAAPGASRQG
jgi:protein SCO1/2